MQKVSKYKIANSYARAWVDVAFSLKLEDKVLEEVKALEESLNNNALVWQKFTAPTDENSQKLSIIDILSKKAKLSDITKNTLMLMVENQKINCIQMVLKNWQELYYQKKSIELVNVETVTELSSSQDKKLQKILKDKLEKDVKINYIINKDLLGGLRISYGSFIIDDTLKSKLENIKKVMLKA